MVLIVNRLIARRFQQDNFYLSKSTLCTVYRYIQYSTKVDRSNILSVGYITARGVREKAKADV